MKRKSTFLMYLVIMVVMFLSRGSAWAQTILRVDDDSAAGSPDGSTWGLAFKRLQDALATVSSPGPQNPYEIWVAAGTYYPDRTAAAPSGSGSQSATFTLRNNVEILGGFGGGVNGETDKNRRNYLVNITILSGAIGQATVTDNSWHVVSALATGQTTINDSARIDGFTIRDGYAINADRARTGHR